MKRYMEDEAVMQAMADLRAAIEHASGDALKNFLVVVQHHNIGGATNYEGCDCSACALAILDAASRPFRFEDAGDFAQVNPKAMAH